MPCLEITLPRVTSENRADLARELTQAFSAATGHSAEIFGVRFFEYEPGQAAWGGKLCSSDSDEPYVHALLYCPRLKRSAKQALATQLTQAFTRALGRPSWKPVVHICEHPYDNVVVNGRLLSDAYDECARRGFYYELPREE